MKRQTCNCNQLCSCSSQALSPYTQIEQMWNNVPPISLIEAQCFDETKKQFSNFQRPNDPEIQEYSRLEQQMDSESKSLEAEYNQKKKEYDQCLKQNGLKTDNCDCPGMKKRQKRSIKTGANDLLRIKTKRQSGFGNNGNSGGISNNGNFGGISNNGDSLYKSCYEREMNRIDQQVELIEKQESRINEAQIELQIDRCYDQFCPESTNAAENQNSNPCAALESALEQLENRFDQIDAKYDQLFTQLDNKYGGGI